MPVLAAGLSWLETNSSSNQKKLASEPPSGMPRAPSTAK